MKQNSEYWSKRLAELSTDKKLFIPEGRLGNNLYWGGQVIIASIIIPIRIFLTIFRIIKKKYLCYLNNHKYILIGQTDMNCDVTIYCYCKNCGKRQIYKYSYFKKLKETK